MITAHPIILQRSPSCGLVVKENTVNDLPLMTNIYEETKSADGIMIT